MTLIAWRHGRTAYNAAQRFQGQLDIPLDDVGERQVKAAAARLVELHGPRLRRLVASDLQRAAATARALAEVTGLPVAFDERLREVHVGQWQGRYPAQIEDAGDGDLLSAWRVGEPVRAGRDGETRAELAVRGAAGLLAAAEGVEGDDTVVVAAHGAVLKAGVLTLTGVGADGVRTLHSLTNAAWWVLDTSGGPGAWKIVDADCVRDDLI